MSVGMMLSEPTETDLELPGRRLFSLFIFLCVSFSSRVLFPILIQSLFFTLFLSNPLFVSSSYLINAVDCGSKPNSHFSEITDHVPARYQSSSASLRAGWQGLRSGLIGGITSIPSSIVRGINQDGVTGAVTGLAKGLIGTVAKPAAGLLDFASGTTLAITQSTRSSHSIGEFISTQQPNSLTIIWY